MTVVVVDEPVVADPFLAPEVHHRLFLCATGAPIVVAMQHYEYIDADMDARRFLTADCFDTEADAERALNELLTARVREPSFEADARAARVLAAVGAPLTRQQAIDAHLFAGLPT